MISLILPKIELLASIFTVTYIHLRYESTMGMQALGIEYDVQQKKKGVQLVCLVFLQSFMPYLFWQLSRNTNGLREFQRIIYGRVANGLTLSLNNDGSFADEQLIGGNCRKDFKGQGRCMMQHALFISNNVNTEFMNWNKAYNDTSTKIVKQKNHQVQEPTMVMMLKFLQRQPLNVCLCRFVVYMRWEYLYSSFLSNYHTYLIRFKCSIFVLIFVYKPISPPHPL